MNIFQDIKKKNNIGNYLICAIIIYIIANKLFYIINYRDFFIILFSILVVFSIYFYKNETRCIKLFNKFLYLSNHPDVINLYYEIFYIRKENKLTFDECIYHSDLFFKNYKDLLDNNSINKHLYEYAVYNKNIIINNLLSIISINSNKINYDIVKINIEKLKNIFDNYLIDMKEIINYNWKYKDINVHSGEITLNLFDSTKDILYNNHFNIY